MDGRVGRGKSLVVVYTFWGWAKDDLHGKFTIPPEEEGGRWPFQFVPKIKLGMRVFLSSEIVLFGSFLGAFIFIRAAMASWPIAGTIHELPPGTFTLVIGVNKTVTFTNLDSTTHTVTALDGGFDSGNILAGRTWSHTFSTPGSYPYHCIYHTWMAGTIVVKSP